MEAQRVKVVGGVLRVKRMRPAVDVVGVAAEQTIFQMAGVVNKVVNSERTIMCVSVSE